MIPASFLPEAEAELWEAVEYYESKSGGLGLDLASEVRASVDGIRAFPEKCPLREDGTRRCLLHRFPYLVVYVYLPRHVWVIAVAHCKRRPGYWRERTLAPAETHEGQI